MFCLLCPAAPISVNKYAKYGHTYVSLHHCLKFGSLRLILTNLSIGDHFYKNFYTKFHENSRNRSVANNRSQTDSLRCAQNMVCHLASCMKQSVLLCRITSYLRQFSFFLLSSDLLRRKTSPVDTALFLLILPSFHTGNGRTARFSKTLFSNCKSILRPTFENRSPELSNV